MATLEATSNPSASVEEWTLYRHTKRAPLHYQDAAETKYRVKLAERLQQDLRNVVNETKRKYVPIKDSSVESLLKVVTTLVDAEIEELKLLQTTILLVTTNHTLPDASLSRALGICLRLHNSKTSAVVNTAAAAIRQCTGAVFDQINRDGLSSPAYENIQGDEKMDAFRFTPASKSAFFLFQDLCLLTSGDIPHWLQGIESISPLLGLELIESVLLNYCNLFAKAKEFHYLLKERVCPLIIKLMASGLTADGQKNASRDGSSDTFGGGTCGSTYVGSSDFGINVRLNRIINLLCSNYFECLNTECEMLISTTARLVENEQNAWRRALALEVIYKIISQVDLLANICLTFDMMDPPSRVFFGLVSTVGGFVQSTLLTSHGSHPETMTTLLGASSGHQLPQKPSFIYRGVSHVIADAQKFALLEVLDKLEAPFLPEGYSLRLAISCLLQLVWSLQHLIQQARSSMESALVDKPPIEFEMLRISWTALLPALSLLLEASADEKLTDSLLLAESVMVVLSSQCGIVDAREAFVAAICKFALPSLFVLSEKQISKHSLHQQQTSDEATDRSPVVIVVNTSHGLGNLSLEVAPSSWSSSMDITTASTLSSGGLHGPQTPSSLFITAKHIQVSKALLDLAKANGVLLDSSWYIALTTMQHLVWMLGLKAAPSITALSTKAVASNSQNALALMCLDTSFFEKVGAPNLSSQGGSVVSKVLTELPTLSEALSTIFENSRNFDEVALGYLIQALCSIATEACEVANSNRDPSHFSVVKMTEVGLANLHRLNLWWKTITNQLLMMCKVTHVGLRNLAVDAIILLIKRVIIATMPTTNFWNNAELTRLVLEPLAQLTDINFNDVQEKQLQCVQYLLNCYGDEIGGSWLLFINITGSIGQSNSDKHIRSAFQCFQLIVTDYLPTLGLDCYPACVDTAAKFGHQEHDLNIALAAVGSLLHLTDFLFQRERSTPEEAGKIEPLWVTVFRHLSTLVRDRRPAMRKSAGQTLFNAIECHSAQFVQDTWFELLWTVFFPLLSDVQEHCANAPMEREGRGGSLLVHHSRDTAAKQWAETVVLTLSGVARCFVSKQSQLVSLDRFSEIWERLLLNAERAVLTPNSEIAQNALSTLRILLDFDTSQCAIDRSTATWLAFWRTWVSIGDHFIDFLASSNSSDSATNDDVFHSQDAMLQKCTVCTFGPDFFALFFDLFPSLFPRIHRNFNDSFFAEFSKITSIGVLGPLFLNHKTHLPGVNGLGTVAMATTPSFMSSFTTSIVDEQGLTQTQRSVFNCVSVIAEAIQTNEPTFQILLVPFIELLLRLSLYAVRITRPGSNTDLVDAIPMNYIIFAEKCLELATQLYKAFASSDVLRNANGLLKMVEALHVPLAAKYKCQCRSTWLLASKCFMDTISIGVPIAMRQKSSPLKTINGDLWNMIYITIRDFLFCQNQPVEPLSGEEFQQHEALDCKFIDLICDQFLSRPEGLPPRFIEQLVGVLGLGSMEASVSSTDFALLDPNTLRPSPLTPPPPASAGLQPFVHRFSTISTASANGGGDAAAFMVSTDMDLRPFVSREKFMLGNKPYVLCRTAIRDVLDRCRFILQRFVRSTQLTGKCPLPRAKLSEVTFAIQALVVLLTNFTAPPTNSKTSIDANTWSSVIDIYPLVVDCIFVAESSQLLPGIHKLLQLYGRLLQPKANRTVETP
ncbi:hypothetical protein TcWFU_010146 [Taenia crassiceps]|uniref:Protein MON2 homolog n=1 Tax=Taenia crassiceps TaxID=6207 RepID=A0ABR4QT83_9CEST